MASALRVLVLTASLAILSAAQIEDFSSIDVEPQAPRVARSLCGKVISKGLNAAEMKEIVDVHNKLRTFVAKGNEKRGKPGPQPPAKTMETLQWSDELAMHAQNWANNCDVNHHDPDNKKHKEGQNMAALTRSEKEHVSMSSIVTKWYDEVEIYNAKNVKAFTIGNQPPYFGHYTQVVWGKTTKVGCGFIRFSNEPGTAVNFLVCNYSPRGNLVGQPVY